MPAKTNHQVFEVATEFGPARAHLWSPGVAPRGRLVLGHGAGGGIEAPDLVVARETALAAGWQAVLVEQPWRVAGKRLAPAPPRLDIGWLAVLAALNDIRTNAAPGRRSSAVPTSTRRRAEPLPLVIGGRSAGARVACRTAVQLGARAVLTLAFPLHPPGRPEKSRAEELAAPGAAGIPVLAVQGARDPFGIPAEFHRLGLVGVDVVEVAGDHSLARTGPAAAAVAAAVSARLPGWEQE